MQLVILSKTSVDVTLAFSSQPNMYWNAPHLEDSSSEQGLMQTNSTLHRVTIRELYVGKAGKGAEKRPIKDNKAKCCVFAYVEQ